MDEVSRTKKITGFLVLVTVLLVAVLYFMWSNGFQPFGTLRYEYHLNLPNNSLKLDENSLKKFVQQELLINGEQIFDSTNNVYLQPATISFVVEQSDDTSKLIKAFSSSSAGRDTFQYGWGINYDPNTNAFEYLIQVGTERGSSISAEELNVVFAKMFVIEKAIAVNQTNQVLSPEIIAESLSLASTTKFVK